jgi:hypothetical protein
MNHDTLRLVQTLHSSLYNSGVFTTPSPTGKNTWLKRPFKLYGFALKGAESRIAPEFSGKLARCTPLSEACQWCYPSPPERTNQGPRVPASRSEARQLEATPPRFHSLSGTEPSGSTPWRRCDGWIHDPIRASRCSRALRI